MTAPRTRKRPGSRSRKPASRRAIVVLGAHRSGTSALTRVVNLLGAELPRHLLDPVPGNNETGFWESAEIVDVHDRLLRAQGSSWDDWLALDPAFLGSALGRSLADELKGCLERDFPRAPLIVLKDPRACRLVPLWLTILRELEFEPRFVLIHRHPIEVAESLERRDGIDLSKGLLLWLRHVIDMERDTRDSRRSFVGYEDLLRDWRGVARRLARELGLRWPRPPQRAAGDVERFLSTKLRHHRHSLDDLVGRTRLHFWVREAYQALLAADEGMAPGITLDRIAREMTSALKVVGPVLKATQAEIQERRAELDALRIDLQRARREAEERASLETDLALQREAHLAASRAYEQELERTRRLLEEFDARIRRQNDELHSLNEARDRAVHDRRADEERLRAEARELEKRVEARDSQTRELERLGQQLRDVTAHLGAIEAKLEEQTSLARGHRAESDRLRHELQDQQAFLRVVASDKKALEELRATEQRQHRQEVSGLHDALKVNAEERRELATRLSRVESNLEESRNQLAISRATEAETVASSKALQQRLEESLRDLGERLEEARRDKHWLWERWHDAKAELAAWRASKVGRVLWWQWSAYLATRRALIHLRAFVTRPWTGRPQAGLGGRSHRVGAAVLGVIRGILGRIYLVVAVGFEMAAARVRSLLRGAPTAAPRPGRAVAPGFKPRVLMVSPLPVYPPHHGGGVRHYNLIRKLAEHSDLHLLLFSATGEDREQREALSPWVRSIHFHHWKPRFDPDPWRLTPPNAGLFASDEVARRIGHLLSLNHLDILQLEYTELGQYGLPRFARTKVVLTEIDIAFRQHWRRRSMGFHRRFPEGNAFGASFGDWLRLTRYEVRVCRRADQIHVMSSDDGEHLSHHMKDGWDRIRVVPNGVDTAYYAPGPATRKEGGALFVGNFQHLPNVDALEFFVREIWPSVRRQRGHASLTVVGAHPSERVTRFDGADGISVVGRVADLRPYYREHSLLIAPIRAGSGTRLKILEALACGLPVVSTTLGAEGIRATPGEELLIADRPDEFASAVNALMDDPSLSLALGEKGRRLVEQSYDWTASAEVVLDGWAQLARPRPTDDAAAGTHSPGPAAPGSNGRPDPVDVSIVIPTFRGGAKLRECLRSIRRQDTNRSFEIVCVNTGSAEDDVAILREHADRYDVIAPADFDHGLTRDHGATLGSGAVLVFLNQDAVPADEHWLQRLTDPLFEDEGCHAVQGGIREVADPRQRFYWDSCGDRFYFTSESERWLARHSGVGFSTINAAIRRSVWERMPFGAAAIMEDKKWQGRLSAEGHAIRVAPEALVVHTHTYRLRSLWRRCQSEGFGWRLVGERYSLLDMVRDGAQPRVYRDLARGLRQGRVRSAAELLYPWLRPAAVYWGNRWSRGVSH